MINELIAICIQGNNAHFREEEKERKSVKLSTQCRISLAEHAAIEKVSS